LQCEGKFWRAALNTWLTDEKTELKKKQQDDAKKRKEEEGPAYPARKKQKRTNTEPDPALGDDLEERLQLGLDILLRLAHIIHEAVCNSPFLATEPGCQGFSEPLSLENTSLLVSVPSKLELYPGRTSSKSWMGEAAVRFRKEQRGTVPPVGAAPAAAQGAAAAADGAHGGAASAPAADGGATPAVADADGGTAPATDGAATPAAADADGGVAPAADADGGVAVGGNGGAAPADSDGKASPPRIGMVRSLPLTLTCIENSTVTAVLMTFFHPHGVVIADTREGAGGP
jgi:hypothetical protein